MIEKIYYTETDYVVFNIPDEGNIGCFMSGGADSSIMCYILAHTIKKHNLKTKIYPITAEMLSRPYNLRCASDVVKKVTETTGFNFELHLCYMIENHKQPVDDNQKIEVHAKYTTSYFHKYNLLTLFNGLTANPPIDAVPDNTYACRQSCRDDMEWRKKQEAKKGLSVPFIHSDKKVIGLLYQKMGRMQDLFPLTRSCEGELDETNFFRKDCFEVRPKAEVCWWCQERAYGFSELL